MAALTLLWLGVLQEWADTCCRGLRSVHAYILVYDICCFDSFVLKVDRIFLVSQVF